MLHARRLLADWLQPAWGIDFKPRSGLRSDGTLRRSIGAVPLGGVAEGARARRILRRYRGEQHREKPADPIAQTVWRPRAEIDQEERNGRDFDARATARAVGGT